ncbi:MAG: hydrogenase expression/formation protein HypE [Pseudomonadota bacterium]
MSGGEDNKTSGASGFVCPAPLRDYPEIVMAHGAGGALTKELIDTLFRPVFKSAQLDLGHDGALLKPGSERIAFTTDSYVVKPLFFPGGDIGSLAVYGTVNDLAMCGARPTALSLGLIIEEGLPMETLARIVQSIGAACERVGMNVVTGDTKVVDHGKGDGLFINMSGVGAVIGNDEINPAAVQPGDRIILSGDVGRHGVAVLSAREGFEFEIAIESDCAPLHEPVLALIEAGVEIHCLRDLTRGGLATALNEIAGAASCDIAIREVDVPVVLPVQGASEILGLDPLYIANEGRFIVILPAHERDRAVSILQGFPETKGAVQIGAVSEGRGTVSCETALGARRALDLLTGEQLPRIC